MEREVYQQHVIAERIVAQRKVIPDNNGEESSKYYLFFKSVILWLPKGTRNSEVYWIAGYISLVLVRLEVAP